MVSFIIIAKEKEKRESYREDFAKKNAINNFDISVISRETDTKTSTQSIGIETIKLIQKKLYFKPIKSKDKLVVIEDAQLLTPEAQNALLKVLEEPPANTFILLEADSQEALLPTILSRCQIITLAEDKKKLSEKKITELREFIQALPDLSIGERLKQAEILAKDKEKALSWIENLILLLRERLLENVILGREATPESDSGQARMTALDYAETIKSFQKLHALLKTTNVNPRFAIEQTLLNL